MRAITAISGTDKRLRVSVSRLNVPGHPTHEYVVELTAEENWATYDLQGVLLGEHGMLGQALSSCLAGEYDE